jgi:hypothetical protein
MLGVRIEALERSHDRCSFSCGNAALDPYLQRFGSAGWRYNTAAIFVAVDDASPAVLGYYTLSMSSIVVDVVPHPQQLPNPVPVAHIGRFAISAVRIKGEGSGSFPSSMPSSAPERAGQEVAAHAVVVDAIDDDAVAFYRHFGFEPLLDDPQHLFLAMKAGQDSRIHCGARCRIVRRRGVRRGGQWHCRWARARRRYRRCEHCWFGDSSGFSRV